MIILFLICKFKGSVYSYLSPILFELDFVDKTGESAAGSESSQDANGKRTTVMDSVAAGLLVLGEHFEGRSLVISHLSLVEKRKDGRKAEKTGER